MPETAVLRARASCRCAPDSEHPSYNHVMLEGVVAAASRAFGGRKLVVVFPLETVESFKAGENGVASMTLSHEIVAYDRVAEKVRSVAAGHYVRVTGGLTYHDGRTQVRANSVVVLCRCLRLASPETPETTD